MSDNDRVHTWSAILGRPFSIARPPLKLFCPFSKLRQGIRFFFVFFFVFLPRILVYTRYAWALSPYIRLFSSRIYAQFPYFYKHNRGDKPNKCPNIGVLQDICVSYDCLGNNVVYASTKCTFWQNGCSCMISNENYGGTLRKGQWKNRSLYVRTPPCRSSLNRGSTDCTLTRNRQYGGSFKMSRLGLSAIYLNLKTFRHLKHREKNFAIMTSIVRAYPL